MLDNCPTCGKRIKDWDEEGVETNSAQRWCLQHLLDTFDVPEMRRDITKPENVGWLLRNLAINNGDHKDLEQMLEILPYKLKRGHNA